MPMTVAEAIVELRDMPQDVSLHFFDCGEEVYVTELRYLPGGGTPEVPPSVLVAG